MKPRVARLAAAALLSLAVASFDGAAKANAPAPFSRPTGAAAGLVTERASPVRVVREQLDVDCARQSSPVHPSCTFVATYELDNPASNEEELLGAFYTAESAGGRGSGDDPSPPVRAELDGVDVGATAKDSQLTRMDAIVHEDPDLRSLEERSPLQLRRSPFRIVVAGHAKARLVFRGELAPTMFASRRPAAYELPPIAVRHVALGGNRDASSEEEFLYLISPIRRWSGDAEVHIRVRYRRQSSFSPAAPSTSWSRVDEGDVSTSSTVVRAAAGENLRFRLSVGMSPLVNGGPVVGIGPRIGREELRVRLGYEVGIASFMVAAASVETNFDEYLTAAMTLDFATSSLMYVIPSLAVGVGAAAQLRTHAPTRVGGRTQLTVSWPLVSFTFPIDVYPVAGSAGSHVEGAFLTQLSF